MQKKILKIASEPRQVLKAIPITDKNLTDSMSQQIMERLGILNE